MKIIIVIIIIFIQYIQLHNSSEWLYVFFKLNPFLFQANTFYGTFDLNNRMYWNKVFKSQNFKYNLCFFHVIKSFLANIS